MSQLIEGSGRTHDWFDTTWREVIGDLTPLGVTAEVDANSGLAPATVSITLLGRTLGAYDLWLARSGDIDLHPAPRDEGPQV